MNIENLYKTLDEKFIEHLDSIVESYRSKEVKAEFSYDIEECETFGTFSDLMIESEMCEVYDLPYVAYVALNDPSSLGTHFPNPNP